MNDEGPFACTVNRGNSRLRATKAFRLLSFSRRGAELYGIGANERT